MMRYVKENGVERVDRTGVGTIGVFGYQLRFDLAKGFPAVTTKKLHIRSIIYELLWFLRGETNIRVNIFGEVFPLETLEESLYSRLFE